jgi:GNAT superfamily N-acetyltransferase
LTSKIVQIGGDEVEETAVLFTKAFLSDPAIQHICSHHRSKYQQRVYTWFWITIEMQLAAQQPVWGIKQYGQLAAAAALSNPGYQPGSRALWQWLVDVFKGAGWSAVWHTLRHVNGMEKLKPNIPHVVLEFIATHPDCRGQGYGRILLNAVHDYAAALPGAPGVWLETANPANLPLYHHFGYMSEGKMDTAVYTVTAMFRPNQNKEYSSHRFHY